MRKTNKPKLSADEFLNKLSRSCQNYKEQLSIPDTTKSMKELIDWRAKWVDFFSDLNTESFVKFLFHLFYFLTHLSVKDRVISDEEQEFVSNFFNLKYSEIKILKEKGFDEEINLDYNSVIEMFTNFNLNESLDTMTNNEYPYTEFQYLSDLKNNFNFKLPEIKSFHYFQSPPIELVTILDAGLSDLAVDYINFFNELGLAFISVDRIDDREIDALYEIIKHMLDFLTLNNIDVHGNEAYDCSDHD